VPRPRITVYLVKYLSWRYNDECTVPYSATFEKAFRSRAKAELYRRELELQARGGDDPGYEGYEALNTNWTDSRIRDWLTQFKLTEPPRDPDSGRRQWTPEWLTQAEAQLGRDEYLRFCELFDTGSYFYHIVETEMEL
jgi:hypothetical protein